MSSLDRNHPSSPSDSSDPSISLSSSALPPATSPPRRSPENTCSDNDNNSNNSRKDQTSHNSNEDDDDNNHHNNSKTSLFSHLTYPISYTTSALLRRLSEDSAPTPLARALSANYNGSMFESTARSLFNPPPTIRRHSPFQPPPLTPLTLDGYKESTDQKGRLLSKALAEEIRLLVPPRLQLVDQWRLAYSLEQDGSSLKSLYKSLDAYRGKRGGFVLVVRDAHGGIFGAYLSDPPHPNAHYFGTGESFLWRAFRLPPLLGDLDLSNLPPPPSSDTTNMTRSTTIAQLQPKAPSSKHHHLSSSSTPATSGTNTPERIRFKAFPYTGENDFVLFCQPAFLSVGGGDGRYGLWLDDSLARGVSAQCPTFMNEGLSDEGDKFGVLGVEVWYLGS